MADYKWKEPHLTTIMSYQLPLLFLLISSSFAKEPLKILVYNVKFGHSHSVFLGNIADILSEEGHKVVSETLFIKPIYKDRALEKEIIDNFIDISHS